MNATLTKTLEPYYVIPFQTIPKQPNLKYYSPLSESDRGGLLLKIRRSCVLRFVCVFANKLFTCKATTSGNHTYLCHCIFAKTMFATTMLEKTTFEKTIGRNVCLRKLHLQTIDETTIENKTIVGKTIFYSFRKVF